MTSRQGHINHNQGALAEDAALAAYLAKGAQLLARRWRGTTPGARFEIDLILYMDGITVFVEVKSSRSIVQALGALSARQQQRLVRAAEHYMMSDKTGTLGDIRFDFAAVDAAGRVEILENAIIL